MIKPLIILFNTVSVFLFSFFFGDTPVTVTGTFPKSAKIATEFVSEIKINKGNVGGFAKLQLEVPQGFTVKEVESKGGNFSFATNIAKIIWTSTPSDAEFTVKFAITADASAAGSKVITSKFSFVNNNNKEVVEMTPAEIMIGDAPAETPVASSTPTETVTPVATTTTSETTPVTSTPTVAASFDNHAEPNSNIVCSRVITNGPSVSSHNVEVRIKKGDIKGFAKFQEVLPAGYTAKGDKTNGSSFSVSDGKLKFVWVSLPTDNELVVSYILEKTDANAADAKLDNGEFSYLENDQSKKVKLSTDVVSTKTTPDVVKTETPVQTPTIAAEPMTQTVTANTEPVKTETTSAEPVKTQTKEVVAKKEGSVVYNVQIGAFRNAIQSDVLSKKFNITETIKSEMAEGYSKFMVGNFNEYKEARSHREQVKQKGCNSAFVVAYNGSKRITVQEALMITSQKWFK